MKPMSDRNRISVLLRCLPIAAVLLSVPVLSGCGGAAFGDVRADAETAVLTLSEWDASWTDKLQKLPALETLDLRGAAISVEDAAAIQAALGDAELLWSIPLGNGAYASDSREITVSDLSAEQVQQCGFSVAVLADDSNAVAFENTLRDVGEDRFRGESERYVFKSQIISRHNPPM